MGPFIRWSCLLIVLVCSVLAVRGDEDTFSTVGRHLLAIYTNADVNRATKERNLREVALFYDAHQDKLGLSSEERLYAEELRKRYADAIKTGVLVEGQVSREATVGPVVARYIVEGVMKLSKVVQTHKSSSAQGIHVNFGSGLTIFGFVLCLLFSVLFK